jgi:hypothetical protein
MSGKHVFFYHPQCGHCVKLLSKIRGTPLQTEFLYINILNAKRLPGNLKGVPAILPAFQPETALLQGQHAFGWIESVVSSATSSGQPTMRSHPDPHGVQNPRSHEPVPDKTGHVPVIISGSTSSDAGQAQASGGPTAKEFIGTSSFEMGGRGFSDKYSFLSSQSAMPHRYSYVGGHVAPGKVGQMVTKEPGDALRDAKGVTSKQKQFETDLKRLQASRDQIPNGIRRVG